MKYLEKIFFKGSGRGHGETRLHNHHLILLHVFELLQETICTCAHIHMSPNNIHPYIKCGIINLRTNNMMLHSQIAVQSSLLHAGDLANPSY